MQEKRNKRLAILFVLLSTATAALLYFSATDEQTFEQKDIFKVEELQTIDRVELLSGNDTLSLRFANNRWWVNETEPADRNMIDVLFATLLQAEAKRPVAENTNDSIAQVMQAKGVRVRLFEQDELRKRFVAGGNAKKSEAYFLNEQGKAYVMHIPGYRVFVSGIFELTESEWRDKYVFAFNWTNFKSLSVQFTNTPSDNFKVKMQDTYFGIEGIETDTTKLNDFLDAVSLLTVDQYTMGDSLKQQASFMNILVTDIADRQYQLAVYAKAINGKTACFLNNKQAAWIDNRKLVRLLKNRDFFKK